MAAVRHIGLSDPDIRFPNQGLIDLYAVLEWIVYPAVLSVAEPDVLLVAATQIIIAVVVSECGMYASLVVTDANVLTMDDEQPSADGLAVYGDEFVAVGSRSELEEHIGSETEVLTMEGKTVLPGFYDAHCHMTGKGLDMLKVDLSPQSVSSIDEMIDVLSQRAEETPAGEWVLGSRYDDTKLQEGRNPTRPELDQVSTEHPIFVLHCGAHHGVVNTKALEVAGWDDEIPENVEEFVKRDPETGEPNGVISEDAKDVFRGSRDQAGLIPDSTRDEEQEALRLACEEYNSVGITSVSDMSGTPKSIRMLMDGYKQDSLSVRVTTVVRPPYWKNLDELYLRSGVGDDMLQIGPVKSTVDGAIAARTAYLSEPYEGRPNDYGELRKTQDEIDELVADAHDSGFQIALHANGDRSIEMVLNAFRKTLGDNPDDSHRHRIEHCTVVNDDLLDEIEELGLVVNPFSTYLYQHGDKMGEYGDRVEMMFAHGSFLERGIPVTGNTDNPAGLLPPLLGIRTMVTRKTSDGDVLGPDQRISVEEALRIYTQGSAYSTFDEDKRGSITPGKLADFVVLSEDPTEVDPDRIHEIDVERTFVGGEQVYAAE